MTGSGAEVGRAVRWARLLLVVAAVVLSGVGSRRSVQAQVSPGQTAGRGSGYVGDGTCVGCHKEQGAGYARTAHHLASQPASRSSVLGSFADGSNVLTISDPGNSSDSDDPRLRFVMEAKGDGLFQTAVAELGAKRLTRTEPFDIVFGSGVRGQTYLYWTGDQMFELPVSYWTEGHRWINSPGYKDGTANYARHVDPRCVECHASYLKALSDDPQTNVFERASFVPGIGCEVCHGPGAAHVALEQHPPASGRPGAGHAILNPAKFERDRKVDQCALCHNGIGREELAPAFSYVAGQPLERYLAADPLAMETRPDVHGNQVGLLKRSRCYLGSPGMSCSTCHEVHAPEREAASYSPQCLGCHQWQSCGASKQLGQAITKNCIDCHMPVQETAAIVSVTAGKEVRASIRTHWIKVYPGTEPGGGRRP